MNQPDPEQRRGPGRPRKWASNAERMRAYRAQLQAEQETLSGVDTQGELVNRLRRLTAERDALRAEVIQLRSRVRDLEMATPRSAPARAEPPMVRPVRADVTGQPALTRAQRRRLDREQRRRNP